MKITNRMTANIKEEISKHNALISNGKRDDGFIGNILDIMVNRPLSKNNGKSKAGEIDCHTCYITAKGKRAYLSCECKVNEGNNFFVEEFSKNYYIILCKCNNEMVHRTVTEKEVFAFLKSVTLHYTRANDFLVSGFCGKHYDKKRILFKNKNYSSYLDNLPVFDNEMIVNLD